MSFSIGPQVKYNYNKILFAVDLKGKYQGQTLVAGMTAKGLNGSFYGDFAIDVDVGKQPIVLAQLPPFKLSLVANDLIIPHEPIQKTLYVEKENVPPASKRKIFLLPRGIIDFNFKNIVLGGEPLSLEGGIAIANRVIKSKSKIRLTTSNGQGSAVFENKFYREGSSGSFTFDLSNVNLKDVGILFPAQTGSLEGLSFGNIEGEFGNLNNKFTYNVDVDFKVKKGRWQRLDLSQHAENVIIELSKIPYLKNNLRDKKLKVSNNFQNFSLKGVFANDRWRLTKYSYISKNLKILRGKGQIYPGLGKKRSFLMMDVDWDQLRPAMLKNFSLQNLPLRLSGVGLTLKPDIPFIAKKLARSHVKKRSKKIIKNLKDEVLKNPFKDKKMKDALKGIL